MIPKISICVFIKDNNSCAFGLWESMATLMPIAEEFFVLDLGSTDGTYETLKDLAAHNPKIRLEQSTFPMNPITELVDAGSFAVIPNEMIPTCKNDLILYYQADEIWHENLLSIMLKRLEDMKDFKGLSFWRYQLASNFQHVKQFPLLVHRIGWKNDFVFVDDGMNTGKGAEVCGNYNGGWFTRWGAEFQDHRLKDLILPQRLKSRKGYGDISHTLPTHEMILDISSIGGFLDNIETKMRKHTPMWRTSETDINIGGYFEKFNEWFREQQKNPDWTELHSPFNIPEIMKPLVGQKRYPQREDMLNRIKNAV